MYNKVILIGNLGKDPEIRHFEGGSMVTKFTLATNENYKDRAGEWQKRTEWHDIVCWGYLAEKAERALKKGSLAFVEGKITHRKWQDQEGKDRYSTEIVCSVLKSLEKREDVSSLSGETTSSVEEPFSAPPVKNDLEESVGTTGTEDDLPF